MLMGASEDTIRLSNFTILFLYLQMSFVLQAVLY